MRLESKFKVGKSYQLYKEIGSGSYGDVALAVHKETKKRVAIKKIPELFNYLLDAKR